MNFVVIGESVSKLNDDLKKSHPAVEWNKIKQFRNFIAHDYFGIDMDQVFGIIQDYIPPLKTHVESMLATD